jgi:RHS repeat-associated protein
LTTDHLGSPRVITDKNGNVISRRDFMPFGEDLYAGVGARESANLKYGTTQDDIRQKFTGYQKDKETQLDFAEARYYNNAHGRFTAVDPLLASGKSANPQSFNRYIYTNNQPLIKTDDSGKNPEWVYDENAPSGINRPVWVSHEEFLSGGYQEWERQTYTTSSGDTIWLDPMGPFQLEGYDDSYNGWYKNGVAQGTGVYDGNTANWNAPYMNDLDVGIGLGIRNWSKSVVDVPNYPIFVGIGTNFTLNSTFGVKPFFNYETPMNTTQKVAAFGSNLGCGILAGAAAGGGAAAASARFGATATTAVTTKSTALVETASGILKPGGNLIGTATRNAGIRELSGGIPAAESLLGRLSAAGAKEVYKPTYSGSMFELNSGGTFGFRTQMTRSPNAACTIDVNIQNVFQGKLKFLP